MLWKRDYVCDGWSLHARSLTRRMVQDSTYRGGGAYLSAGIMQAFVGLEHLNEGVLDA
jgi:hypothetical protein